MHGHGGEQHQADCGDDHQHRIPGEQEHQQQLGHDEYDQAGEQDRAGLEHVDLGGHAEHREHEEERRADAQRQTDRAQVVDHEDRAQREAHQCGIHVEHHAGGARLDRHDAGAEEHGQTHLHHGEQDEPDQTGGLEERHIGAAHLREHGHHGRDDQTDGHLAIGLRDGDALRLLEGVGRLGVDGGGAVGRIGVRLLRVVLVLVLRLLVIAVAALRLLAESHHHSLEQPGRMAGISPSYGEMLNEW